MKVPEAVEKAFWDTALQHTIHSLKPLEAALEQLREELEGDEAVSKMLTILGERDWGLLHPTGDITPAAIVEQTSADLRAAIEVAFSVLGDKEEGR